ERTSSDSRRTKLRQMLSNLYARTSSGVHAEVAREEAQALMLQVYLLLGEIVSLPTPSDDPLSNASFNS
ncbi:MAG TPA: hypothetical protein VF590_20845, partial [Isosphaeraceae bacterium]